MTTRKQYQRDYAVREANHKKSLELEEVRYRYNKKLMWRGAIVSLIVGILTWLITD